MNKHKRVVVYIPESQHSKLRAKLILSGKTVSGWFRELIDLFLKN